MPSRTPDRKSYAQVCPMATALDVVGDRWTPLLLRELLGGPARFTELHDGLPGIARNLLTTRLRRLEEDGVVRRVQGQGGVLYALTDHGAAIRRTLEELAFWGARLRRVAPAQHERSVRAIAMALHAVLVRAGDRLPAQRWVLELEVDGEPVEIALGPRPSVTVRPATDVDARVRVAGSTFAAFLRGAPAGAEQFVHLSGDPAATAALLHALGLAEG